MPEWFSPGAIRWTEGQVLWLLEHYDALRNGNWPPDPSSYIDPAVRKPTPSGHAPFEPAVLTSSEISRRLEDCGYDGVMVLLHYAYGQTLDAIAKYFSLDKERVASRVKAVLRHISRWNYHLGRYRRWNVGRGVKS